MAILLSVLGVSDEDIADDYAMTALTIEPLISEWLDEMSSDADERTAPAPPGDAAKRRCSTRLSTCESSTAPPRRS